MFFWLTQYILFLFFPLYIIFFVIFFFIVLGGRNFLLFYSQHIKFWKWHEESLVRQTELTQSLNRMELGVEQYPVEWIEWFCFRVFVFRLCWVTDRSLDGSRHKQISSLLSVSSCFAGIILQGFILRRSFPRHDGLLFMNLLCANLCVHVQSEVTRSKQDYNHLDARLKPPLSLFDHHESGWFQVNGILITCHCLQHFLYIYDNFFLSFYWNQCWLNQVILISNLTVSSQG